MGNVPKGVPETPLLQETPWWKQGWFWLASIAIVLAAIAALALLKGGGESENNVSGGQNQNTDSSGQAVAASLTQHHEIGDVLSIPTTYWACEIETERLGSCLSQFQLHQGDFVQVRDKPEILNRSEKYPEGFWHWPIKVLRGGVYVEGLDLYVLDSDQMYGPFPELPSRRKPDFEIGEQLLVGYNFILRQSPSGEPVYVNQYGNAQLAYGRDKVTLIAEPTLGNDGHYWCQIQGDQVPLGWIPCELQRIE